MAFLEGYVEALGEPTTDLDALLFDALLAGGLAHFHNGGRALYCPWRWDTSPPEALLADLEAYKAFATEVRGDPPLRALLLQEGLAAAVAQSEVFRERFQAQLQASECYQRLQAQLLASPPASPGGTPAALQGETATLQGEAAALPGAAQLVTLHAAKAPTLVVQVRSGTDRLELAELLPEGGRWQQWRWGGGRLQHVATGLYLDAEVP